MSRNDGSGRTNMGGRLRIVELAGAPRAAERCPEDLVVLRHAAETHADEREEG
ncbi:MAG: hypothetical protein ACOC97_02650 [Myxococcota bacterium]